MPQVEDGQYCDWVARRAVARAALHLGIEDMTEEALHVLASCLLDYLRRIGSYTAANAEASGRSTLHCNVLDAIRAVELCTCPSAINGSLMSDEQSNGENENGDTSDVAGTTNSENESKHSRSKHPSNSWKSLAQFCFGVDWDQEGYGIATASGGRGIGSKGAAVEEAVVSTIQKQGGWSAPFPEEIPIFPTLSRRMHDNSFHSATTSAKIGVTASPDTPRNTTEAVDSDGDRKMEDANNSNEKNALEIDEEDAKAETKLWGVLLETATAQPAAVNPMESSDTKTTKKRKAVQYLDDGFLPCFYPPLPATAAKKVAKVKEGTAENIAPDAEALMSVRAALVVPSGLSTKPVEPKAIVPVARASSAPVSRILEGSMDPAQP